MKYTINDTVVVELNSNPHLSWSKTWQNHPVYENDVIEARHFSMNCDQFDTSTTYGGGMGFDTNLEMDAPTFLTYSLGSCACNIFHPQVGGFYVDANSNVTIYFEEFNPNHVNGYFYGDFYKPADSTTAYITCDFDFTP